MPRTTTTFVLDDDGKAGYCHCTGCSKKFGTSGKHLSKTQLYKHQRSEGGSRTCAEQDAPEQTVSHQPEQNWQEQSSHQMTSEEPPQSPGSGTEDLHSVDRIHDQSMHNVPPQRAHSPSEASQMYIDDSNDFGDDPGFERPRSEFMEEDLLGQQLELDGVSRSEDERDDSDEHGRRASDLEQDEEEYEGPRDDEGSGYEEEEEHEDEDEDDELNPLHLPLYPPEPEPQPNEEDDDDMDPEPEGGTGGAEEEEYDEETTAFNEALTNSAQDNVETNGKFLVEVRNAKLADKHHTNMSDEMLHDLRNPPEGLVNNDVEDPDISLSLQLYIILGDSADVAYRRISKAITKRWPNASILSHHLAKKKVAEVTGIYPIRHDMCVNSCIAYTGPFRLMTECPNCSEPRYDPLSPGKEKPRQSVQTIPIAPQLQALYRSPRTCIDLQYMSNKLRKISQELTTNGQVAAYNDFFTGKAFLDRFRNDDLPKIDVNDPILMFSIDGCQLYRNKTSDCWIYIWVLFNHSPDKRYKMKYVMIGAIIPGPKKPVNLDSFLFPGLHHLSAIQREGLTIWRATDRLTRTVHPFLALATADGPAMALLNGFVGYHGRMGCRFYCNFPGRHPEDQSHYYPASLQPVNFTVANSNHPDISLRQTFEPCVDRYCRNLNRVANTLTTAAYERERLLTGISRGSIFSGLPEWRTLGVPLMFGSDIMHLCSLNITDLLSSLWRGTMRCIGNDRKVDWRFAVFLGKPGLKRWKEHGAEVTAATQHLPGSFDRPPRNPAEKINSGYKAWEWLLYIFGLGPALLYKWLPLEFWQNFCSLVYGVRIAHQYSITSEEVLEGHEAIITFAEDFERLYYCRLPDRLHFVRPAIHSLIHIFPEVQRVGPGVCSSQWTMERTIGNLGREIRQPSNPFANLQQRGIRRAQVNALILLHPSLDPYDNAALPSGAKDLGGHYALLRARDRSQYKLTIHEAQSLSPFLADLNVSTKSQYKIHRWARVLLPTGQIGRSAMTESKRPPDKTRCARNVKFIQERVKSYGEVQYYFQYSISPTRHLALAMVSVYSDLDQEMFALSRRTVLSYKYGGVTTLKVVEVKSISSVVAMVPHQYVVDGVLRSDRFFVVEKPGLSCAELGGANEAERRRVEGLEDNENNGG